MTKIILCGCFGRMGAVVRDLSAKNPETEIVAGVDITTLGDGHIFPTYCEIDSCTLPADVIIDFMPPSAIAATMALLQYSVEKEIPVVLCTTGLSLEIQEAIQTASKQVAIFQSANLSLSINLVANMLERAAKLLYESQFDIEVIEKHHNQKLDAPSGTALLLAETINNALGGDMHFINNRSDVHAKRKRDEIGLHALRGGSIVGEHSVIFAGQDEVIEFTHIAQSRDAFAVGALKAAHWIKGKPPGLYSMQDLINAI